MGTKSGDKGRYHRNRRKKLHRREEMRALRKELAEKAAKKEPPLAS